MKQNIQKALFVSIFLSVIIAMASFAAPAKAALPPDYYDYYNYNYNNYNYYGVCNTHAYRLCQGSSIFWFDSCDNRQDMYQTCPPGSSCQYGQCVPFIPPQPPVPPPNPYNPYASKACYGNFVYWYDSLGAVSGLYKSCSDNNSCTKDSCAGAKCENILKCDGSTCAFGSTDYCLSCDHIGNGVCDCGETSATSPADCKAKEEAALSVSFLAKQDAQGQQWNKTLQVSPNSTVYFMLTAKNDSAAQSENVAASASLPGEISLIGNIKMDNSSLAGDIISGISIGSLAPYAEKTITFEGKTQAINAESTKQAVATITSGSYKKTDSLTLNFQPSQTGAVSGASQASGLVNFLKRWYLWILVGAVLIFLFIVVFRRLSSNY